MHVYFLLGEGGRFQKPLIQPTSYYDAHIPQRIPTYITIYYEYYDSINNKFNKIISNDKHTDFQLIKFNNNI